MRNIFFVCLSHTLTDEQVESLNTTFGNGNIVLVSPELKKHTSQIPADASLQDIQCLAADVVSEAIAVNATHFICAGEPTFAMWANMIAGCKTSLLLEDGFRIMFSDVLIINQHERGTDLRWKHLRGWSMECITSTTERVSVQTEHSDGSVTKTAVFKHVQWRNMF